MSKIGDLVEGWVLKIALKKGVKAAGAVILAAIASVKVAPVLAQLGVTVDPGQLEIGMTTLGTAAVTVALSWLKQKTSLGRKFL
jgi:hypothetical protein